jgi:hypothetical protein
MRPSAAMYTTPTGLLTANPPVIMAGAGDISECSNDNDEATAKLLDDIPGTVFTLGDNVMPNGTSSEFANCYDPTWGRHKARTRPAPGNHDYNTSGAAGYFGYFGAAAGDPGKGYYSYDLGAWHIVVLNSNIATASGSAQDVWLKADLAAHPDRCTLAYYHHPLYSSTGGSGTGGATYSGVRNLVVDLYAAHADLILNGHRHVYERLAPMTPDGTADPVWGVREIISGTGGDGGGTLTNIFPLSEVRNGSTFGVLRLYLYDDSYAWKFVPVAGKTFTDSGSTACHSAGGSSGGGGGTVSAGLSTVSAAPASIVAGTATSTITVSAKDENGDPLSGLTVVLSATGTGNTLIQPTHPTDAAGVATGTFRSSVAEPKTLSATIDGTAVTQTAAVLVIPAVNPPGGTGTITHTLLTAGNNASNGKVYTTASIAPAPDALITVAVLSRRSSGALTPTVTGGGMTAWVEVGSEDFDSQSSPHRRFTIFRAMSSTPGSGPITITYQSSVSNAQWIVSQWQGVETSGSNGAGAIAQVGGTASDGASSLTVPLAAFSDPNDVAFAIAGVTTNGPAITPGSGFSAIAEQSSGEKSDLGAEWATNLSTVSASWSSNLASALLAVELKAGSGGGSGTPTVSASLSTVAVAPSSLTAGSGAATITVTVNDGSGNPMSGVSVQLAATGSGNTLTQPASVTDANGVATGSLSSTVAEDKTITATAGGVQLASQPVVSVSAGPADAAQSTVAAAPTSIVADADISTITVTAKDANGNPVSGATVVLAATGSGNTLTQPASVTDANGTATGTLASSVAEDKTVSATIDGTGVNQTVVVTVTPGSGSGVSASLSAVAIAPTALTAGASPATITVTVQDGTGTPLSGVTVLLAASGTGNTLTQPASVTDANGTATGSLTSTVAEDKTITATADGVQLSSQPVLSVTAGAVDAAQSTVVAAPTSIVAGSGTATITVTARDGYGNPVPNQAVSLTTSGTNYTLTQPASNTDAAGGATGTLSATAAQTLVVSATAGGTPLAQTASVAVTAAPPPAAISHTLLTSGTDPANGKVYTTASVAPAPNTLILVAVLGHRTYGAPPAPTISGGGMTTWDQVATVTLDPQSAPLKRLTIFRAMSAAPGSGPLTITFSATVSNAEWVVSEFSGVDQSGTNGAGAIVQTGSAGGDGVNGLTVPLAAFANANDVAYGAFGVASGDPAVSAGSGFTAIAEEPSGETPADLFAEWAVNDPSVAAVWTSLNGGALGVEIKAGTSP